MPLVSVIVPVYNAQEHLEQMLESVCAQTLKDIEILCVDDGSTDESAAIIARLAQKDSRIRLLSQQNAGAGAARNHGLGQASGQYLSFLDADDFYEGDMLEKAFGAAQKSGAEVVIFGADFYDDRLNVFMPCTYNIRQDMMPRQRPFAALDVEKDFFKIAVGWAWDKLFETAFIRENGLLFQEQRTTNDAFFVFCAMAKARRIETLPEVLAHQRRNAGGTLSVTREKSWQCFYQALIAIRDQLNAWGLYAHFEADFINYALHFSLWNLNTLKGQTKKLLYNQLRSGWFEELGIAAWPRERFYHPGEYRQYLGIMNTPYSGAKQWCITKLQRVKTIIKRILGR